MTEPRIRWERNEDDHSLTGRTGTMTDPAFWIWPPEAPGKAHILTSSLPGHDKDFYPDGFVSDVKAKAEEWLAEHVASLGAVFPVPGRVAVNEAALEAFIHEARSTLDSLSQEFCVGAETERAAAAFESLVTALGITGTPETAAATAGEKEAGR